MFMILVSVSMSRLVTMVWLKHNIFSTPLSVDGQWAGWMQWSGCSNNCGPGTRTRQRLCLDPRPSNEGSDCSGSASETENCTITGCEGEFFYQRQHDYESIARLNKIYSPVSLVST